MLEYDTFLYEVAIYKIYKKENRSELIYSKFYTSNKILPNRNSIDYIPNKKKAEIVYDKSLILVGAPKQYIENLPKPKIKNNEKRNRTVRNRKV